MKNIITKLKLNDYLSEYKFNSSKILNLSYFETFYTRSRIFPQRCLELT